MSHATGAKGKCSLVHTVTTKCSLPAPQQIDDGDKYFNRSGVLQKDFQVLRMNTHGSQQSE